VTLHDANAHLGGWPFRRLPFTGVGDLLARMDAQGIERAAVCNTQSVLYRNVHEGNRELAEWLPWHRDRLVPVATLDPKYPGCREDLTWCAGELGARALRLLPRWHGFDLPGPEALDLARHAADLGLALVVPGRLEDTRQRHRLAPQSDVTLEEVLAFARALPEARVLATELPLPLDEVVLAGLRETGNLCFEISRMPAWADRGLVRLVNSLGAGRFLFGTGMPFKVPEVAALKLATLHDADAADAVGSLNFQKYFG